MENRKLLYSLVMLLALVGLGTLGYYIFEPMPLFEAFYMTIITMSTVGFSEVIPLTTVGRVITVLIIILGITVGTYTVSIIVQWLVGGEIQKVFGRKKLHKQIIELNGHFIICGFGRIGQIICKELFEEGIKFVVIEQDASAIEEITSLKFLFIEMDATSEEALLAAGILKAKGLVTAVNSDANNVFITLTAKGLRPDIFVLARASEEKNEEKLIKAGATRVVSPYLIGGRRMAHVLKRPTVVDFLDIATINNKLGLLMEEVTVRPGSGLVGKNLIESRLRQDFGIIIVAIKKSVNQMIFNPAPSETLDAGDVIVAIGQRDDLKRMDTIL